MKKIFVSFVLLLFVCFLSSCTQKTSETLKFATWGSATELGIIKPIIQEYEKLHPETKIELLHIPQNYFQKIHLLFASNLAPDVIFINNINLPIYAELLEPLEYDKTKYHPQVVNSLSINGTSYAVPRDVSNLVIYYNKNIFKEKKVDIPSPSWTISDMFNIAQKLTDKKHWGISYEEEMFYAIPYINAFGQDIYDYTNSNSLIGLKLYKDLAYRYNIAPQKSDVGSKTVAQLFIEGRLGMHLSGRWLYPKYKEVCGFDWGVMTFPTSTPCDASGWAIAKSSKQKQKAKEFIDYLSSKENITRLANTGLIVPARNDVNIDNSVFIDAIKKSIPKKLTKDYTKMLDRIKEKEYDYSL